MGIIGHPFGAALARVNDDLANADPDPAIGVGWLVVCARHTELVATAPRDLEPSRDQRAAAGLADWSGVDAAASIGCGAKRALGHASKISECAADDRRTDCAQLAACGICGARHGFARANRDHISPRMAVRYFTGTPVQQLPARRPAAARSTPNCSRLRHYHGAGLETGMGAY